MLMDLEHYFEFHFGCWVLAKSVSLEYLWFATLCDLKKHYFLYLQFCLVLIPFEYLKLLKDLS